MKSCVGLFVLVLLCSGCGQGATARRIDDAEGGHYPLGEVHFVERGQRAKGVFVAATKGGGDAFGDLWTTMLVPAGPGPLNGPVWPSEGSAHGQRARDIAALPDYRSAFSLIRYGD